MKRIVLLAIVGVLALAVTPAVAEDRATEAEAKDMVQKAVADYKIAGKKMLDNINVPNKMYVSKDLYLVAYDMNGMCLAHGQTKERIGKMVLADKDVDGKEFIRERMEKVKTANGFWQTFKYIDPLTKKILPKKVYCEKADAALMFCGGVYSEK